jgi:septal ring factor EnvC (AmiA/AmiB activator)
VRITASSRLSSAVLLLFAVVAVGLAATPRASAAATPQQRLIEARRGARIAAIRAERLAAAASQERDAAERARAEARAMAARIDATRADIAAARIRLAILEQLLTEQRAALGVVQSPIARLLAALQSLARRPTIVAVAQPGSVDDLVHVRAVLGTALPAVRLRADAVRTALRRTRRLQAGAAQAACALRDGRIRLEAQRVALAKLEATHRRRSQALGRGAIGESDRAIALGERARDLVDSLAESGRR